MVQKPKIQYVGQFYVPGSEAQVLQRQNRRKARTKLPPVRAEQVRTICIDPVAIVGIAVAVFMLAVMAVGALRIHSDWTQYEQMKGRVVSLKKQNAVLSDRYHNCYDLESVRKQAESMGLVPRSSLTVIPVRVTIPEPPEEPSWLDDLRWFFEGLL